MTWLRASPKDRISDGQLRQRGISPEALRRWFLQHHGITFHAFQRMLRINTALRELRAAAAPPRSRSTAATTRSAALPTPTRN